MTEYVKQGGICRDQFLDQLCDEKATWKLTKESNEIKVFSRIVPGCSKTDDATVFKTEVLLDVAPRKLFVIIDPRNQYRPQWDLLLEKVVVAETIDDNFSVVHHVAKSSLAGIVSARDSIDICSFGKIDDSENYYIIAGSIESHPDYLPTSKYVRVFHYPSGYRIYPVESEPNKCKFLMFFNTDLKMNMVASKIADKIKPKLMTEKVVNLRKWINDNMNIIDAM